MVMRTLFSNFLSPRLAATLLCGILMMRQQLAYGQGHVAARGLRIRCPKALEPKDGDDQAHKSPEALEALRAYMEKYGYLDTDRRRTSHLLQEMGDAIGLMQHHMGITETKHLDAVTHAAVGEPRCGHPDNLPSRRRSNFPRKLASVDLANAGTSLLLRGGDSRTSTTTAMLSDQGNLVTGADSEVATKFAYFSGNPRWKSRLELTWALSMSRVTQRLSRDNIRLAFRHAFQLWAETVPMFRFTEVENYETADVKISFVAGDHGDSQNFDGVLGIIAHAFSPEDGRVHFDDAEFWSVDVGSDKAPQALDLTSVAIHEVGHVIGLGHSPVRKSVMFPSIAPHHTKRELSEDDVEGVRQLYGLELVPAPSPHLVVDRANVVSLKRAFLPFLLLLNLMILMS